MELYQALITLDGWTFLAQICNLMIQLFIFKKFLLNPVKNVIAERKAKADSQIADATKLRTGADIAQERKKAVNEVKDEIGGIAMEIASKVVEREISEKDHKDLIDEFIKNVGEAS